MHKRLVQTFVELIKRTSTDLPEDIEKALVSSVRREKSGSPSRGALKTVLENVALARERSAPLCQDTGTNIWYIYYPVRMKEKEIRKAVLNLRDYDFNLSEALKSAALKSEINQIKKDHCFCNHGCFSLPSIQRNAKTMLLDMPIEIIKIKLGLGY